MINTTRQPLEIDIALEEKREATSRFLPPYQALLPDFITDDWVRVYPHAQCITLQLASLIVQG